jgi:hypothetical protein
VGVPPVGGGMFWGKGIGRWIWCKKCIHMYVNAKMIPAETIPGIGVEGKGEQWRGWIQVWCIWYTVRTFVNGTRYPIQHNNKGKKNSVVLLEAQGEDNSNS